MSATAAEISNAPEVASTAPTTVASTHPPVRVEKLSGLKALELPALWHYRNLLWLFIWRDLKASQKQTLLGVVWLVLSPLVSVLIFTLVFGKMAQLPSDGMPYALMVFTGYVLWNAFSSATLNCVATVANNANLVKKVYLPRLLLPLSTSFNQAINLSVNVVCLLVMAACFGYFPTWRSLLVVPIVLLPLLTALGGGLWLAPLHVKYRDVLYLATYGLQLGFYVTPILYPASMIPAKLQPFLWLNPLVGQVQMLRWAVLQQEVSWINAVSGILVPLLLVIGGACFYARHAGRFADTV